MAVFALQKEIQFHSSFSQSQLSIMLNVTDNFLQLLFISTCILRWKVLPRSGQMFKSLLHLSCTCDLLLSVLISSGYHFSWCVDEKYHHFLFCFHVHQFHVRVHPMYLMAVEQVSDPLLDAIFKKVTELPPHILTHSPPKIETTCRSTIAYWCAYF